MLENLRVCKLLDDWRYDVACLTETHLRGSMMTEGSECDDWKGTGETGEFRRHNLSSPKEQEVEGSSIPFHFVREAD